MNKRILSFIFLLIQLSLMSGQNHNQYAVPFTASIKTLLDIFGSAERVDLTAMMAIVLFLSTI